MKRYILITLCTALTLAGIAQNSVVRYEYWFDKNYSAKQASVVQPNTSNINFSVLANNLPEGIHSIYFRFQDNTGKWSSVTNSYFLIPPKTPDQHFKIQGYEYWFDKDNNGKVSVSVSNVDSLNLSATIQTSQLTNGIHNLYYRFKDTKGNWSSTVSSAFLKVPLADDSGKEICRYEYWFDQNYNAKVSNLITASEIVLIDRTIDINALTIGLHTLNIRFANKAGEWSAVSSDYFTKQLTTDNKSVISFIKLYPNPFTDKLCVSGLSENSTIRVFDLNGKTVLNQRINSNESVNTSSLPSGNYIIKLSLKTDELEWKALKK
jgi:hypothetical protein